MTEEPYTFVSLLYRKLHENNLLPRWFEGEYAIIWFNAIIYAIFVVVVVSVLAVIAARMRNKEKPGSYRNFWEIIVTGIYSLIDDMLEHKGRQYIPYLGALFLYIFTLNLLGIIPGMFSPTVSASTTFALGITTIIVVHYYAIKHSGIIGHLKHFSGDVLFLAPLMFVIHIVGELARPISLSLRLYGNIFGEETMVSVLSGMARQVMIFGIIPIPIQLPMVAFAIFTSLIQAFIFVALTSIYIATFVTEEH